MAGAGFPCKKKPTQQDDKFFMIVKERDMFCYHALAGMTNEEKLSIIEDVIALKAVFVQTDGDTLKRQLKPCVKDMVARAKVDRIMLRLFHYILLMETKEDEAVWCSESEWFRTEEQHMAEFGSQGLTKKLWDDKRKYALDKMDYVSTCKHKLGTEKESLNDTIELYKHDKFPKQFEKSILSILRRTQQDVEDIWRVSGAEGAKHIKWQKVNHVTSLNPFGHPPSQDYIPVKAIHDILRQLVCNVYVLDLFDPTLCQTSKKMILHPYRACSKPCHCCTSACGVLPFKVGAQFLARLGKAERTPPEDREVATRRTAASRLLVELFTGTWNPTHLLGLLKNFCRVGQTVFFFVKADASVVWEILRSGWKAVAPEENAKLLNYLIENAVNSFLENLEHVFFELGEPLTLENYKLQFDELDTFDSQDLEKLSDSEKLDLTSKPLPQVVGSIGDEEEGSSRRYTASPKGLKQMFRSDETKEQSPDGEGERDYAYAPCDPVPKDHESWRSDRIYFFGKHHKFNREKTWGHNVVWHPRKLQPAAKQGKWVVAMKRANGTWSTFERVGRARFMKHAKKALLEHLTTMNLDKRHEDVTAYANQLIDGLYDDEGQPTVEGSRGHRMQPGEDTAMPPQGQGYHVEAVAGSSGHEVHSVVGTTASFCRDAECLHLSLVKTGKEGSDMGTMVAKIHFGDGKGRDVLSTAERTAVAATVNVILFRYQMERSEGRMRAGVRAQRKKTLQSMNLEGFDCVAICDAVLQPDHIVVYALYRWASGETYESETCNFGIGRSSNLVAVRDVTAALLSAYPDKISWLTGLLKAVVLLAFADKGFPNCHGCINCTHIYIGKPANAPGEDYYDRKRHFSVQEQVVVDLNLRVLDVFVGYSGSCHDVKIIHLLSLWSRAEGGELFTGPPVMIPFQVQTNGYLLGDNDHPASEWVVVPYGGLATHPSELRFDNKQKTAKGAVERAFGRLKGMWRLFLRSHKTNMDTLPQQLVVVCILHNILIDADIPFDDNLLWEVGPDGVRRWVDLGMHRPVRPMCMESSTGDALMLRHALAERMSME
ncbi:hypothetical protein CBR_g18796 [Chara braunii]|uniref:DDE Tnp4 domain-containing protein n=1 Tax=Chara braunii TaxID=69332 RepID=A0A388KWD9_CHABU|nr:hypothetical protein CBR_g18796 [Chara braunii]|eukprot:GBG74385.1 hypothetical protein CBR_g18796 [Chara braunii]